MSKKKISLWISPKMLQNNRKAWFSNMWLNLWRKTFFFHIYPLLLVWSKTLRGGGGGDIPFSSEICTFLVPVITFFPFFSANNYYISLFLIVCALRRYVKSFIGSFFRRYSQTSKGLSKNGTPQMENPLISRRFELQTTNFLCSLLTSLSLIWLNHIYNATKCWLDMRHFISHRAKILGTSVSPPLLITITQQSFMLKKKS